MSKEEILKIQVCVLAVNIHCDGCKDKVKKVLQKIDGVFTTKIDAEQGKVTVSGNVDPSLLIKKLAKAGKHATLWGSQKPNGNNNKNIHNQMENQFKNMNINAKGGNDKGQKLNGNNNVNQGKGGNNPQQNQLQQQLQQLKALQNMMPQLKDHQKMGGNHPNQKAVKFVEEDDDEISYDEYDDELSDEYDDDEFDDEDDEMDQPHHPINKMMMNGLNPQFMNNALKGAPNAKQVGPAGGGSGGGAKNGNGGQKGGGTFNGNGAGKNGGGNPQNGHNGGGGGGGGKDNSIPILMNGGKNGGAMNGGLGSMVGPGGSNMGQFGNMNIPLGQINNMSMPQMGNIPAVQGLPAASNGGPSGSYRYYQGSGPDMMASIPSNQQQQYLAMMNQQRAMGGGNERFQPMMYARPPSAVNYMPPYPYQSQYPPHYTYGSDPYSDVFSDENSSSSCNIL